MNSISNRSDYSFEHGIDHCGYDGIAPILYVGGPVTLQDFVERDLSKVRGVSISQRGLPRDVNWEDLNPSFLFEALPRLEYLRITFEGAVSLEVTGPQPMLRRLIIDCPKARGNLKGDMPLLQSADLRWPERCTAAMRAPNLTHLSLFRPLFENLETLAHLSALRELDISHARNFRSFQGLEHFNRLDCLELRSCPRLADLNSISAHAKLKKLVMDSCAGLLDVTGVEHLNSLEELSIFAGERGPKQVRVAKSMSRSSVLKLRAVAADWV